MVVNLGSVFNDNNADCSSRYGRGFYHISGINLERVFFCCTLTSSHAKHYPLWLRARQVHRVFPGGQWPPYH